MKKLLSLLIACAIFITTFSASAFEVPSPTGFITDTTGRLTLSQISSLNQKLVLYRNSTQNEIAVLMIPSLDGEDISDATQEVYKTYKIGKAGLDNGVLLMIALGDHKTRLQTGKGVEGDLTDIECKGILDGMKPYLKQGQFYEGIDFAINKVEAKLETRAGQKADPGQGQKFNAPVQQPETSVSPRNSSCDISTGYIAGGSVAIIFTLLLAIFLFRRSRRTRASTQELEEYYEVNTSHLDNCRYDDQKLIPTVLYLPSPEPEGFSGGDTGGGGASTDWSGASTKNADPQDVPQSNSASTYISDPDPNPMPIPDPTPSYTSDPAPDYSSASYDSSSSSDISFGGGDTSGGGSDGSW